MHKSIDVTRVKIQNDDFTLYKYINNYFIFYKYTFSSTQQYYYHSLMLNFRFKNKSSERFCFLGERVMRELSVLKIAIIESKKVRILQNNNPSRIAGGVTSLNPLMLKSKIESSTIKNK